MEKNREVDCAISEIIHCLSKANGYYYDDIAQTLCKDEKWQDYFKDSTDKLVN